LRLNELGCRNRQPRRRDDQEHRYCAAATDDAKSLQFDRTKFPCDNTPIEARPPLVTPIIDELAATGIVFPRAYVPGVRCNNSRRAIMHGRYQRHLQYLFESNGGGQSECRRGASNLNGPGGGLFGAARGCDKGNSELGCTMSGVCGDAYALGRWSEEAQTTATPRRPVLESISACGSSGYCVEKPSVACTAQNANEVCPGGYVSYLFAKTESMQPGQGGFDPNWSDDGQGNGKVKCASLPAAQKPACFDRLDDPHSGTPALRYGDPDQPHFKNPDTRAFFDPVAGSLYSVVQAIDGGAAAPGRAPASGGAVMHDLGNGWVQRRPFFIWFGPNIPHAGTSPDRMLEDLYDPNPIASQQVPYYADEFLHYARVSWLDMMTGGLVYHLKRACTCGTTAGPANIRSLYDNTVIIMLMDNGFLPVLSKTTPSEDAQRTPLIINAPEYRATVPQRVFADEIPNAIDLLPTIIEYSQSANGQARRWFPAWSGSAPELTQDYPHGHPLRTLIGARHGGAIPDYRRNLVFGEQGDSNVQDNNTLGSGMPRYVVTRPGLFGVCETAFASTQVHPCLDDSDCNTLSPSLGRCVCPPNSASWCTSVGGTDGRWKRCVNRPYLRCSEGSVLI